VKNDKDSEIKATILVLNIPLSDVGLATSLVGAVMLFSTILLLAAYLHC